jgi:hypothetical protein
LSIYTSGGTLAFTEARSLLCTARMLLAKSACALPVLLLAIDLLVDVAFSGGTKLLMGFASHFIVVAGDESHMTVAWKFTVTWETLPHEK